ncbi:MAG: sigma-70 family RNA polymerase sigma factor [Pirellulales bacterium]
MPLDLRRIIRRALAGDQAAMAELVHAYEGQVFGLCYRLLGSRPDAEDMAQESFVRALRALASWDPERPFEPWLLAIAANRCRTLLAKRKRRPATALLESELADPAPERHAAQPLVEEVTLALAELREEYRQAFVLFHEYELSYHEIAEALGCPLGTVKTWVHRARRELIDRLRRREVFEDTRYAVRTV